MPLTPEEALFDEIAKLYDKFEKDRKALLDQYKASNQKYPIGFTFPYKGEIAKINGCFVYLFEPDSFVYISYACYVPSYCDREISKPFGGTMIMGDKKDMGVNILQVEIDRILEEINNA